MPSKPPPELRLDQKQLTVPSATQIRLLIPRWLLRSIAWRDMRAQTVSYFQQILWSVSGCLTWCGWNGYDPKVILTRRVRLSVPKMLQGVLEQTKDLMKFQSFPTRSFICSYSVTSKIEDEQGQGHVRATLSHNNDRAISLKFLGSRSATDGGYSGLL